MSLKAFVVGVVLLTLQQLFEVFGGNIDPSINKVLVAVGAFLAVIGGVLFAFDR